MVWRGSLCVKASSQPKNDVWKRYQVFRKENTDKYTIQIKDKSFPVPTHLKNKKILSFYFFIVFLF